MIAHRGESYDAPENTLAAIHLAWERGARAVEVDVRLTSDGELVVLHDPDLRRVAGVRIAAARASAAALRAHDVGAWKAPGWVGERVPLLREVLASVPSGGRLFVEIKVGPEIVSPLAAVLAEQRVRPGSVILMSFRGDTMRTVAAQLPSFEACLLLTARQWRGMGMAAAIDLARKSGCASLDVETHRRLTRDVVDTVHAARMALYVWTVNRVTTAGRLAAAGIDGITTDRCAWLRARLGA